MMSDIKRQILRALREAGDPLDHFQVAADIGEAPFRVRAELRDLARRRWGDNGYTQMVRLTIRGERFLWELTTAGLVASYGEQMGLGV